MKALVLNNKVIQVEETEFPVSSNLTWVNCADDCEPGWVLYEGFPVKETPDEKTVREAAELEALPRNLKEYRAEKVESGVVVGDMQVDTDSDTRTSLVGARILAKEDPAYSVNWKTEVGFTTLNSTEIIVVADAVAAHVQKCFTAEQATLVKIEDGTLTDKDSVIAEFENVYNS